MKEKYPFSCRKELREQLKRQMEEKCATQKLQLVRKVKEAEYFREVDRLALSSEREHMIQHRKAMTAYRDENKRVLSHTYIMYSLLMLLCSCSIQRSPERIYMQGALRLQYRECLRLFSLCVCVCVCVQLMEQSWRDRALIRSQEALKERELLCLNPINWSGTLK